MHAKFRWLTISQKLFQYLVYYTSMKDQLHEFDNHFLPDHVCSQKENMIDHDVWMMSSVNASEADWNIVKVEEMKRKRKGLRCLIKNTTIDQNFDPSNFPHWKLGECHQIFFILQPLILFSYLMSLKIIIYLPKNFCLWSSIDDADVHRMKYTFIGYTLIDSAFTICTWWLMNQNLLSKKWHNTNS